MPIVKSISIHESPERLISYILNPEKNEQMKLTTGLNCHADKDAAYEEFKEIYDYFANKNFYRRELSEEKKTGILMFHYIQSFKPDECTPELAHKIGVEWARKVFGEDRAVLVSTHDDRKHIHNHFAVSIYDNKGVRWHDNKTTLKRCREVSDKLAIKYGLSVIEKKKYKPDQRYGDWIKRQLSQSWKVRLAEEIDRLIMDSGVNSVDDLTDRLREQGYEVRQRKYISIRPPKGKHFIRSFRLGDGYSLEVLTYRIKTKGAVMSEKELFGYEGIQYKYALCLREIQLMMYRQANNSKVTYRELARSADLLCFMVNKHIRSEEQFKALVDEADEKFRDSESRQKDFERRCEFEEKLIADSGRFLELWNKERTPDEIEEMSRYRVLIDYELYKDGEVDKHREKLTSIRSELETVSTETERLKEERKTTADCYRYYLEQMSGEFGSILERKQKEQTERERLQAEERIRLQASEREREYKNTADRDQAR
ncbi:MAG: relaxase/mobilization nuclease domain-containing protein [Oribacterium sp.]|nr:relaxase/mobilization nuclease domain-containing protein [Oribacterium sp.]